VRLKLRHLLHRNAASLLVRHAAHFEQVRTVSWQMMGAFRAHKPTAIVRPWVVLRRLCRLLKQMVYIGLKVLRVPHVFILKATACFNLLLVLKLRMHGFSPLLPPTPSCNGACTVRSIKWCCKAFRVSCSQSEAGNVAPAEGNSQDSGLSRAVVTTEPQRANRRHGKCELKVSPPQTEEHLRLCFRLVELNWFCVLLTLGRCRRMSRRADSCVSSVHTLPVGPVSCGSGVRRCELEPGTSNNDKCYVHQELKTNLDPRNDRLKYYRQPRHFIDPFRSGYNVHIAIICPVFVWLSVLISYSV
jgi:hypothetical protein